MTPTLPGMDRAPKRVRAQAARVLTRLHDEHYLALGGKKILHTRRGTAPTASVPVGLRWRILGRLEAGRFVPTALLSHAEYNHVVGMK